MSIDPNDTDYKCPCGGAIYLNEVVDEDPEGNPIYDYICRDCDAVFEPSWGVIFGHANDLKAGL